MNDAVIKATQLAHSEGGVPCLELRTAKFNEIGLGALFAFFETACAISALLLGVNPFNQPGVESYKTNLFTLMGKPGFEDMGKSLRARLLFPDHKGKVSERRSNKFVPDSIFGHPRNKVATA